MFMKRTLAAGAGIAAGLAAGLPPIYLFALRRDCLTWGARPDEVSRKLAGDELLPDASLVTTRAITIDAPPEAVWPWLVQMGSGRGGAYSYDWIENLFGLNMHSASEILPEYQDLKLGDELPLGPDRPVMRVEVLDPPRALALRITGPNIADQAWAWIFALRPEGETTRLISRNRIPTASLPPIPRLFYTFFMEPGSLVMERKMLLGIKQRAERSAAAAASEVTVPARLRALYSERSHGSLFSTGISSKEMTKMPGIIVGIDGSVHSRRALDWAIHEAAIRKAPLTVLTVHQAAAGWAGPVAYPGDADLTAEARKKVQEETDSALEKLDEKDRPPSVTVEARNGFPATELLKAAEDADMIVTGSRGAGGFAKLMLGSVSSQIVQHAHCPVVVVPGDRR